MKLNLLTVALVVALIFSASIASFIIEPEEISELGDFIKGGFRDEERTGGPGADPQGGGAEGGGGTPN